MVGEDREENPHVRRWSEEDRAVHGQPLADGQHRRGAADAVRDDRVHPAQLVGDFLANRASNDLASVVPSYQPGVTPVDLSKALPEFAITAIREAIPAFDRKIKGFAMADAVLTGIETRTSSPICIRRDAGCQSVNTRGLYPAGEGAGYAGGILSAGIDGIKVAEAIALDLLA